MTAAATDARVEIAAALRDGLPAAIPVYDLLPAVIRPPLVALEPRDPYLEPLTIGYDRFLLRLAVAIIAPAAEPGRGFAWIEETAELVYDLLPPGVTAENLAAPRITDLGAQGPALVAEIDLTIPITIEEP